MKNKHALKKLEEMKNLKYPYEIEKMGLKIIVNKNVYPTSKVSELLIDTLDEIQINGLEGMKVLDYGTGAGFLAIQCAKRKANVTAIDINPYAIECGKQNAISNNVEVGFVQSDGTSKIIDKKFDIILAGMPWDNDKADDYMEMALFDTNGNMKKSLFENAYKILEKDGYILMTYSDFMMENQPIDGLITDDIKWEIISKKIINDSMHYIIKLWLK